MSSFRVLPIFSHHNFVKICLIFVYHNNIANLVNKPKFNHSILFIITIASNNIANNIAQ